MVWESLTVSHQRLSEPRALYSESQRLSQQISDHLWMNEVEAWKIYTSLFMYIASSFCLSVSPHIHPHVLKYVHTFINSLSFNKFSSVWDIEGHSWHSNNDSLTKTWWMCLNFENCLASNDPNPIIDQVFGSYWQIFTSLELISSNTDVSLCGSWWDCQ